jgi:Family of unknown function (DUF5906)
MSKDDKLSLEEAQAQANEQERFIDDKVVSFTRAAPRDDIRPGYEGTARPDIEDFLDHGAHRSYNSDEPLAFYDDVKFALKHFNRIFAKVLDGHQDRVIWERHDNTYIIMSYEAFHNHFQYSLVRIEKKVDSFGKQYEWIPATRAWLKMHEARSFRGTKCYPGDIDPNDPNNEYYNKWKGFAVEPIKDTVKVKKILRHIYEVNCLKNKERANHLLDFFAHMYQKPTEKPSFSIMIVSEEEGSGKSMIINAICEMVGINNAFPVSNLKMVFGDFNEIMDSCLLLSFEESDIKSNIRYTRELRDLITNPYALVNKKHKSHHRQPNFTRVVFIGNAEVLAYISRTDRRHTILRSAAIKIGKVDYFKDLKYVLDNGGKEALMYYLLHKDISKFTPFMSMWTEELDEQKELSTDKSLDSVWLEWLESGSLPFEEFNDKRQRWITVQEKLLYCMNRIIKRDGGKELSMKSFGRKFRKIVPPMTRSEDMKYKPDGFHVQLYAYDIPSLKECRAHFAAYMGWKNKVWNDVEANWEVTIVDKNIWFKGW